MEDDIAQGHEALGSGKGEILMGGSHWERLPKGGVRSKAESGCRPRTPPRPSHLQGSLLSHPPLAPKQMAGLLRDWR